MNLSEIIVSISIFLAIASFLNGEKLRKRLNDLEDMLREKGLINKKDIVDKILQ